MVQLLKLGNGEVISTHTLFGMLELKLIHVSKRSIYFNVDLSFVIHVIKHLVSRLTHCGLVTEYGGKDLGQHWLR